MEPDSSATREPDSLRRSNIKRSESRGEAAADFTIQRKAAHNDHASLDSHSVVAIDSR
jgi:hypothetical protein